MIDMKRARELVQLEDEAKAAAATLNRVSAKLVSMGADLKLSSWDWNRPGEIAAIMPQAKIIVGVVALSERPS